MYTLLFLPLYFNYLGLDNLMCINLVSYHFALYLIVNSNNDCIVFNFNLYF